ATGELAHAQELIGQGRWDDAAHLLEDYTKKFPDAPDGWKLLAKCYENVFPPRVEDENRALDAEDQAQTQRSAMATTFQNVGSSARYQQLVQDDPLNAENTFFLALSYLVNDKNYTAAKSALDQVASLGIPADLDDQFHDAMGLYWMGVKDWDKARKELQIAENGSDNELALSLMQDLDKLQANSTTQSEQAENDPTTRFNELVTGARQFMDQNDDVAAVDLLQDALKLKPDDAGAQAMLAGAKRQGAIELYLQGKQLVDTHQYAEAYGKFDKAVTFDSTNASASLALEYVQKKLAQQDRPKVIRKRVEIK
ncbi:MAG: tetratricopeptide repeat protein, partial [Cyanobacteria bacterium REEB65]|nr:tetratricopeptide repeat protein [Cyanobacteria bacterium REEB65]